MRARILVADDEETLRVDLIRRITQLWPEAEIVAEASNGQQALEAAQQSSPDVAFLDVRMPEGSGLEVARGLAGKCHVIFVTAYDDAAVPAFEAGAIDYLMKPVTDSRLRTAIARVQQHLGRPPDDLRALLQSLQQTRPSLKWVQATNGKAIEFVSVNEVHYFQADEKYTVVFVNERELLIRTSLKELLEQLDGERFWQIHRSTIVNIDFVERVVRLPNSDLEVQLKSGTALRVSRTFRHRFRYM